MIVRQALISLQLLVMPPCFPETDVLFISIHIRQIFVKLAQFLCEGARRQARKRRNRETKKKRRKRGGQGEVVLEHQRERVEEKVVMGGDGRGGGFRGIRKE